MLLLVKDVGAPSKNPRAQGASIRRIVESLHQRRHHPVAAGRLELERIGMTTYHTGDLSASVAFAGHFACDAPHYPIQSSGFSPDSAWLDEYHHLALHLLFYVCANVR